MTVDIGKRVREIRIQKDMKIEDLADKVGLDASSISRLETGKQKSFTAQSLGNIATALNISVSELFSSTSRETTVYNNSNSTRDDAEVNDVYHIAIMDLAASAGNGTYNQNEVIDIVRSIEYSNEHARAVFGSKPESAVKVITVKGDSMSGTIEPGDLIFVDISVTNYDGDGVYVFGFDEKIHVKRLQMVPDKLIVISDNPHYRDWSISPENEHRFHIFGKVMISQSQEFKRHG